MKRPTISKKMAFKMILFFLGISLLFCISSAAPGEIARPKFNYSNPNSWGKIAPDCSHGKRQSPIDIIPRETVTIRSLGPLSTFYHILNSSLLCNGLSVQVAVEGKSELLIAGKTYKFLQMHWHTPSEHRINGIRFPAELHQVHKADDGSISVVAILYEYGKPDPIISTITPYIKEMYRKETTGRYAKETTIPIAKFPSMLIKEFHNTYYRYSGSFTTPPCTEIVIWNVISKARTITREQVGELRELLEKHNKRNARPVQPLNGRVVHRFV